MDRQSYRRVKEVEFLGVGKYPVLQLDGFVFYHNREDYFCCSEYSNPVIKCNMWVKRIENGFYYTKIIHITMTQTQSTCSRLEEKN